MKKRILSVVLLLAMMVTVVTPISVLAAKPTCNIEFPDVVYIGEEFVIKGEATYNTSRIDIVNIAIYNNSSMSIGIWCFREEGLNAKSFDFEDEASLFTWGDIIRSVNPNSTDAPFDTGAYGSVYVEVIVKAEDGTSTKRTATIIVEDERKEPDVDLDVYPSMIELGESFEYEGTAYGNDYVLNTVTVGFTYYLNEYNYSNRIATETGYIRYTGLSTDERDVRKTIETGEDSYISCTDETGKTSKKFYFDCAGIYTITLFAWSNEYNKEVKITKKVTVTEPVKTEIPKAELTVSPGQVSLGESFEYEGTAYGNDYTLNTVTVGFTYYSSEYNYSQKIATDTGYLRNAGLSTDEYDVYKEIQTGSNSYLTCTDETGKTTKRFYWGYVGIYTITLYAWSDEYNKEVKITKKVTVTEPVKTEIPKAELTVSPGQVSLGESFEYEGTAYGNDYTLNTVTVGFTYYSSEYNYSQKIATDTGYLRNTGLSTDEYDVYKEIQTGSNSYLTCTDETGKTTKQFYWGYVGIYTITLFAGSTEYYDEYNENVKTTIRIDVISPASQILGDINNDGEITNKDRFILNRYLAGMAGYTDINKTAADINGDGDITGEDVDYLTNYLAGVKGYESLPDIDSECLHTNCNAIYAGKTVFVNNTIKNDGIHSYYHMWYYICKECGEDLGEAQGDNNAVKGAMEKNVSCTYNSDGVCSCGAIDTSGYTPWTAKNITGKQISVYDTPYSTDGSYGKIFVDESVVVLGSKAGRYLIEYTVTSTNAKKQGYVNTSSISSTTKYKIKFDFETVTLPATGKTVLLVPYKGYASYTIEDNLGNKVNPSTLHSFTIEANSKIVLTKDKYTINGENAGICGLCAYYVNEDGKKEIIDTPDFCAVIGTEQKIGEYSNCFLQSEVESIKIGMDMFMSSNVPLPSVTDWTTWDGFLYYIETFKDNIVGFFAGAVGGTTGEQREMAAMIGEFIQWYIKQNDKEIALSNDGAVWASVFSETVSEILKVESFGLDIHSFPSDVQKAFQTVKSLMNSVKDSNSFIEGLKAVETLIDNDVLSVKVVQSVMENKGVSLSWFKKELSSLIKLDILQNSMDFVQSGVDTAAITFEVMAYVFADYSSNLEVLEGIKRSLTANDVYDETIIGAINILQSEYTNKFKSSLGKVANFAMEKITDGIIGLCPVADVLLTVSETVIKYGTTVKEESDLILFQYFMYIFMDTIEFDTVLFTSGKIGLPYETACLYTKLYFNMALYVNQLSLSVDEASTIDKTVIQSNIVKINEVIDRFDYYFN